MAVDSLTRQIAEAALGLTDLPTHILAASQRLAGDLLLVAAAGQAEPSSRALSAVLGAAAGRSQCWFASDWQRVAPADAAFANTLSAAALDYDSLNGTVHADLVTLPAAWAMAEHCQRTPQDMLKAYAMASELVSRLARGSQGVAKGWSATSLYGGIGAALASGLLLQLDVERLTHALGLAALQAAGSQQANIEHTLAKRLQPALAARNGVQAALLAQAGASAPQQALEGRFGLRALYQPGDDSGLLDGWGQHWQLLDTAIKGYPVCACSHAAVQALLDLRSRCRLPLEQIASLTVHVSPFMQRLVGGAFDPRGDLQVLAQFNLPYQLASVLLRGRLTLQHLQPDQVLDAQIAQWLPRIHVEVDHSNPHELAPILLQVTLNDGRVLEQRGEHLPGSPQAPLSLSQLRAKAQECGQYAQPAVDGRGLLALVDTLEQLAQLPHLHHTSLPFHPFTGAA